jgi:N-hydroxyarylamine O-acetyltransferase
VVLPSDSGWDLIRKKGDGTVVPQYRFTETPREMSDFAEMCLYHQTSPDSHFTQNRICSLALPDGRVTISGLRLIEAHNGSRQERELRDRHELESALRERFGVDFQKEIDWSRLAR